MTISFESELKWMFHLFDQKCQVTPPPICLSKDFSVTTTDDEAPRRITVQMYRSLNSLEKYLTLSVTHFDYKICELVSKIFATPNTFFHRFDLIAINQNMLACQKPILYYSLIENQRFNEFCDEFKKRALLRAAEKEKSEIQKIELQNGIITKKIFRKLTDQYKEFSSSGKSEGIKIKSLQKDYWIKYAGHQTKITIIMQRSLDDYLSLMNNSAHFLHTLKIVTSNTDQNFKKCLQDILQKQEKPITLFSKRYCNNNLIQN